MEIVNLVWMSLKKLKAALRKGCARIGRFRKVNSLKFELDVLVVFERFHSFYLKLKQNTPRFSFKFLF